MKIWVVYDVSINLEGAPTHDDHLECDGLIKGDHCYDWSTRCEQMVAFSRDKELVDEWLRPRKKKWFAVKKYKISKEDYKRFANKHNLFMLVEVEMDTRDTSEGSRCEVTTTKVVMTNYQHGTTLDELTTYRLGNISFLNTGIFKRKYERALNKLGYDMLRLNARGADQGDFGITDFAGFRFDEVLAYVNIFRDQFKE